MRSSDSRASAQEAGCERDVYAPLGAEGPDEGPSGRTHLEGLLDVPHFPGQLGGARGGGAAASAAPELRLHLLGRLPGLDHGGLPKGAQRSSSDHDDGSRSKFGSDRVTMTTDPWDMIYIIVTCISLNCSSSRVSLPPPLQYGDGGGTATKQTGRLEAI